MIERRSGNDRRQVPRFSVRTDVEWETRAEIKKGALSDISTRGCFVLCSGEVEDGERVKLYLPFKEGLKVQLDGEIANHFYEIGFAVRFDELSDAQVDFIGKYIDRF